MNAPSSAAQAAREAARRTDGRFGTRVLAECSELDLGAAHSTSMDPKTLDALCAQASVPALSADRRRKATIEKLEAEAASTTDPDRMAQLAADVSPGVNFELMRNPGLTEDALVVSAHSMRHSLAAVQHPAATPRVWQATVDTQPNTTAGRRARIALDGGREALMSMFTTHDRAGIEALYVPRTDSR